MKIIMLSLFLAAQIISGTTTVQEVSLQQLQNTFSQKDDILYVVNFWATWCKPCVGELPYFENANKNFPADKVKVILVSLDFPKEKERLKTFVSKREMASTVYHLNETNANVYINKIDSSWSGAIPATVFYKNGKKVLFHEGEFNQQELDSIINNLNNK